MRTSRVEVVHRRPRRCGRYTTGGRRSARATPSTTSCPVTPGIGSWAAPYTSVTRSRSAPATLAPSSSPQRLHPGVPVRLHHRDQRRRWPPAGDRHRHLDLRRACAVVVEELRAARRTSVLEASVHPGERGERSPPACGDTDQPPPTIKAAAASSRLCSPSTWPSRNRGPSARPAHGWAPRPDRAELRRRDQSASGPSPYVVPPRRRRARAPARGRRVVPAGDHVSASLGERRECPLDLISAPAIEVDVVHLDVGDDADGRTREQERTVALVRLDHEQVPAPARAPLPSRSGRRR